MTRARALATAARRTGHPRDLSALHHAQRVAQRLTELSQFAALDFASQSDALAAAWLHHILEDGALSTENLFDAGIDGHVVCVVGLLTWTGDRSPGDFYAAVAADPVAVAVKLADLDEHLAASHLRGLSPRSRQRLLEAHAHARDALLARRADPPAPAEAPPLPPQGRGRQARVSLTRRPGRADAHVGPLWTPPVAGD